MEEGGAKGEVSTGRALGNSDVHSRIFHYTRSSRLLREFSNSGSSETGREILGVVIVSDLICSHSMEQ